MILRRRNHGKVDKNVRHDIFVCISMILFMIISGLFGHGQNVHVFVILSDMTFVLQLQTCIAIEYVLQKRSHQT